MTDVRIGRQRYEAAQMKLTRRFSQGLAMTVAYTSAKTLEQVSLLSAQDVDVTHPLNSKLEKRLAQFDVPRQLSVIGSYDLPLRRGIFGGWTISGVFMSHSGIPLQFPNAPPLHAKSAKLTDSQRDTLARQAGRTPDHPPHPPSFDTSPFPR